MKIFNFLKKYSKSNRNKVFIIGFNKCGTKTIHHFFRKNGYKSAHHLTKKTIFSRNRINIAKKIQENIDSNKNILDGLESYEIFSDMIYISENELIEGNKYFRQFHEAYQNAYFVFNDRPLDKWINSRFQHISDRTENILFHERYASAINLKNECIEEYWRKLYLSHKYNVLNYFRNNEKFIVFNIESDSPVKLIKFFEKDFKLDPSKWIHRGSTEKRQRKIA